MAFQPVQLSNNIGVNAGLAQLGASLGDLANRRREQERYKIEQARLNQQDQRVARMDATQALAQARALAEKGDLQGAQALLALAGGTDFNVQESAVPGGVPPAMLVQPPPPAMGGSAVPDGMDQGRKLASAPTNSDPEAEFSVTAKGPAQGGPDPLEALMKKPSPAQALPPGLQPPPFVPPGEGPAQPPGPDQVDQLLSQFGQVAPRQAAPPMNAVEAGFQKDRQRQADLSRRLLNFRLNGQDLSIDPDAERNYARTIAAEDRQRQAGMIGGALGDQKYDTMLTKLTAVYGPEMASKMIIPMMEKDAAERQRATLADSARTDRWNMFKEGEKGKDRRAAMMANRPLTTAQAADDSRANAAAASALLNQELAKEDYKEQRKNLFDSQKIVEQLASDNPAAQRAALGTWAKLASGPGTVQQSERDEFVNMVGGKSMQMRRWANEWVNGGRVPEEQKQIFQDALKNIVISGYQKRLGEIQQGVRSAYETHPLPQIRGYADWAAGRVAPGVLPKAGAQAPKQMRPISEMLDDILK